MGPCTPRSTSHARSRNGPLRWRTPTASIAFTSPAKYASTAARIGAGSARSNERREGWTSAINNASSVVKPEATTVAPEATTENGPTGVSIVNIAEAFLRRNRAPQMQLRVGAPGPPALGMSGQGDRVGRQSERGRAVARTEVGRQQHVGIAQRSHQDVIGCPRPDTGQLQQRRAGLLAI